ncbi:MAG TPA: hypothetical protein VF169_07680 [Albitalea sp.]|uniref:hypothetical protein n=1 Tax=Piscinibacter sp. TaxID=1903157 RepID=UPI002ED64206
MESFDKPVADKVLQAMAQAYPDLVDLSLLSMVMGCEATALQAATAGLVKAGLAQAQVVVEAPEPRVDGPSISDRGMAVALGLAENADDAAVLLDRLEARTLRSLLAQRVKRSRLPDSQLEDLRSSLDAVPDTALVDAAKVWAHQPVSDWRALIGVLLGGADSGLAAAQPAG